jgi:hypothetical protein
MTGMTGRTTIREIQKAWYDAKFGPLLTWRSLVLRGWTKAAIRDLLGEPDCLGVNPDGGPRVKLYSEARVLRAQARAAAAWTSGRRQTGEHPEVAGECNRCERGRATAKTTTA